MVAGGGRRRVRGPQKPFKSLEKYLGVETWSTRQPEHECIHFKKKTEGLQPRETGKQ